ncbi:MAG TPA: hypothetical protein VN549_02720 [Negativicutes bacterium]|nr:hypothetical protein [Negativicutes bacterium]
MGNFKEIISADMAVFFNMGEFATVHNLGGRELPVIVDNDRLAQRTKKEYEGIYIGDLLFYVQSSIMGTRPKPGMFLEFDSIPYEVFDATEDSGVYEIILKASES